MSRYLQDQNKVLLLHESGTYGSTSGTGVWIGQVKENSVTDDEGKIIDRYLGTASRSYGMIDLGPRDVNGTLTYHPQDMRLVFFAIGSIVDSAGYHRVSQINSDVRQSGFTSGPLNPPLSFTLEDSKQSVGTGRNFIRTINGCIPNVTTLNLKQGEKATVDVDYIGQHLTYGSGNTTALTELTTTPYLWSSATLQLTGSPISTAKEISLEINQNLESPHYVNGSRDVSVPFMKDRDYNLTVNLDLDGNEANMLYENFYKNNNSFNGQLDMNQDVTATGSQHTVLVFSGCKITSMENPSTNEGATESIIEIKVQNITGSSWDIVTKYNPW